MLNHIIDILRQHNAVFFPRAEDKNIQFVTSMVTAHKFSAPPPGYAELLKISDGLTWNGLELYGTRAIDREVHSYVFPGLIEANLSFIGNDALRGKLILGRTVEELFVYNGMTRKYELVERLDLSVNMQYPTFSDMFYAAVNELF